MLPPAGSSVIVRDEHWRVARVDAFDRCSILTLEGINSRRLRVIHPFEHIATPKARRVIRRSRSTVIRTALAALRGVRPPLGLWTAAAASIDLLPYQLEPALAVLRGATRVMLADAVGLGKTIQAGLILSELRARGLVDRALILCPAGLRAGWASELQQRFGIQCAIFDQATIAEIAATLPPAVNPWTTHAVVIASIDLVKRAEVMAALTDVPVDLVIADEAHHLTPGTERGAAVHALASRAPWCVLATATPHSGDEAAFTYLSQVGAHDDGLTIFRRSRREAGLAANRRERVVRMHPSEQEINLITAVEKYVSAIWHGRAAVDRSLQLVAITIARRALSSRLALERTLRRRLTLLCSPPAPRQASLPWDEEEDEDGCGAEDLLAKAGFTDEHEERCALERVLALLDRCEGGTKIRWLIRNLQRVDEPVLVFTEYRDTLDEIVAALPSNIRHLSICGATTADQRRTVIAAFNAGAADVLVATDVAGEGLNLHHRCRLVIDLELPWNPVRLEQRLGRVDRLGQHRRVHAWRLFHPGTIEERVLAHLRLRRDRASCFDAPPAIDERAMAAAVFDTSRGSPAPALSLATTVVAGANIECDQLVRIRQSANLSRERHPVGSPPRRRCTTPMIALHMVSYVTATGGLVAEYPHAQRIDVDGSRVRSRLTALAATDRVQRELRTQIADRCASIEADRRQMCSAVVDRIAAIRARLAGQRAGITQHSLFDGRTAAAAASRNQALGDLDTALEHRAQVLDEPVQPDTASSRLVAIWPAERR